MSSPPSLSTRGVTSLSWLLLVERISSTASLKTEDTVGLSGEERITEDHSLLDRSEGPHLVKDQFILSDLLKMLMTIEIAVEEK